MAAKQTILDAIANDVAAQERSIQGQQPVGWTAQWHDAHCGFFGWETLISIATPDGQVRAWRRYCWKRNGLATL